MAEWNATVRPYATLSSSLHLPTGSLGNSLSWLLWIEWQWTWEDRCLFDMQISFLLDICPEVGLRDHMVNLFWVILFYGRGGVGGGFHAVFHCGYGNLHSKQQYIGNPSHLLPSIYFYLFLCEYLLILIIAVLTGIGWQHFLVWFAFTRGLMLLNIFSSWLTLCTLGKFRSLAYVFG